MQQSERVIAYRSQYGNAYLKVTEQIGNRRAYTTINKNKDGSFVLINAPTKFSAPLHSSVEMSKKGDYLEFHTRVSIQNDEEREIFKSFINGTLIAANLPEAPKRGRPADAKTTTQTAEQVVTNPVGIEPTQVQASTKISRATPDQIKMAGALVNAKQATDIETALGMLGV